MHKTSQEKSRATGRGNLLQLKTILGILIIPRFQVGAQSLPIVALMF